jgi:hypothetical protein
MNLEQIKDAVRAGKTVHWASASYRVVLTICRDGSEQWLIKCDWNNHRRGLHRDDGTMLEQEDKFFIPAPPIKRGEQVRIKPEWQDKGDDAFTWMATEDEAGGRVSICPIDIGLTIKPIQRVESRMLEGTGMILA